ncbi:MAG: prepilin-type N-terminal cleavage/methylation domain-containing protein [Chloroflexi bacterium]|nr:prepilin-type N-terminal cleavage/methylation domain-containing protein [Chloroflexota bacterium]
MIKSRKGSKGFTLIELMVVMGILAVLMAIVLPTMVGIKAAGIESQVKGDGDGVQKAVDRYNNDSIVTGKFPDRALVGAYPTEFAATPTVTLTINDKTPNSIPLATFAGPTGTSDRRVGIDFDAITQVWNKDGTVLDVTFVPDMLGKEPESQILMANESAVRSLFFHEFIWVMRVSGEGKSTESRTVEVYRLTDAKDASQCTPNNIPCATYTQIY